MDGIRGDPAAAALAESAGLNATFTMASRWLDGWLLRLAPGKARRARCINALTAGLLPLDTKLERAAACYRQAGLPCIVRITPFTQPATLDAALEARGWRAFEQSRVWTAALACADVPTRAPAALPAGHTLVHVGIDTFAEAVGHLRGSAEPQWRSHAQRLHEARVPVDAVLVERDGEVVAAAQAAREDDWVGLYDVATAEASRGRGLARHLCARLLQRAMATGARHAYLQVGAANAPAHALYRGLGFTDAFGYHYRSADPGAD